MNLTISRLAISVIALATALNSCKEDNEVQPKPTPVTVLNVVQFESQEHTVSENSEAKLITINLASPATANGTLTIEVNTLYRESFTTTPATVNGKIDVAMNAGSKTATFSVVPVNNTSFDGSKPITFKILSVSKGFSIGTSHQSLFTITDDERPVEINFQLTNSTLKEKNNVQPAIQIIFSAASLTTGQVQIKVESNDASYGEDFTTIPPATNGFILLDIPAGILQTEVQIVPVNDLRINGTRHVTMSLANTTGAIVKGHYYVHGVTITDDELEGISKGYSTSSGSWEVKRYFAYNENGTLAKVLWEQHTPGYLGGSYVYTYNGTQLEKETSSDGTETIYTTEAGRITKSEKFRNGVLKQYTLYGYDDAGNVGETAIFYRQTDGEMKMGLLFVYLYSIDGNLYKQMSYNPNVEEGEEPALISTHTYGNYFSTQNPFPTVEILPNKPTQNQLPGFYQIEENGKTTTYTLRYEFDAEGRAHRRTATAGAIREVTDYSFYTEQQ